MGKELAKFAYLLIVPNRSILPMPYGVSVENDACAARTRRYVGAGTIGGPSQNDTSAALAQTLAAKQSSYV
jgi:hypothetical protein